MIGAGPAGLMAAGQAALAGADTLLLEKMARPGRKLSITGKGRCNITNIAEVADFIARFGKTGLFLRQPFARFFNTDLMDFFTGLGLNLITERGGRVFPASGKAQDVLTVLLKWLKGCGADIRYSSPVDKLMTYNGSVAGVVSRGKKISCDALILATGGASYPLTGSTGDGYKLAASLGHRIVPIRPALVPVETSGNVAQRMADLNLRNINVRMFVNGKRHKQEFGEVVFTKFGLTGPVILKLSGEAVDAIRDGCKVTFSFDLKPALDDKKLDLRLIRDFESRCHEEISSVLRGLLPREMVQVCFELIKISPEKKAGNITAKERRRLRCWLKDFQIEVTGYRPFSEAIITAGGIETREVDPRTMESRIVKGVFIAGELLDIQADTGGYNLQAAFSTGWLAGRSAAKRD